MENTKTQYTITATHTSEQPSPLYYIPRLLQEKSCTASSERLERRQAQTTTQPFIHLNPSSYGYGYNQHPHVIPPPNNTHKLTTFHTMVKSSLIRQE